MHATIPMVGGADFAVRRIYCVGQNYRAHAIEMGSDPDRAPPFFFTKPADAILPSGATMPYPAMTQALEHEVELVIAIGAEASNIGRDEAMRLVHGYAVGLDMTRRDLQAAAKKAGRPWDMAKGFDHSAPCGALTPAAEAADIAAAGISLLVNGETRQSSAISDMIWSIPEIIAELSRYNRLMPGDLIYTGTPDGVGKVSPGDHLQARIDGLQELQISIGER